MTSTYTRWMAIGDSITQHGPKESLGWRGETRGMAASSVASDYVHILLRMLQARDPGNAKDLKIVGRLGKLSGGTVAQVGDVLEELVAWDADLVTIQLGENDRFAEIGSDEFARRYRLLISGLLAKNRKPLIICSGVWDPDASENPEEPGSYAAESEPDVKDSIIKGICREHGLVFAPISHAALRGSCSGSGESVGVRWHPNDKGMQAYAEAFFEAINQGRSK